MRSNDQPYVPMDYRGSYADICQLWNDTTNSPTPQTTFDYKATSSAIVLSYNRPLVFIPMRQGWAGTLEIETTTALQASHIMHQPQPNIDETPLSEVHLRLLLDKDLIVSDRYRKAMLKLLQDMKGMITDYGITSLSDRYDIHHMPAQQLAMPQPQPPITLLPAAYLTMRN